MTHYSDKHQNFQKLSQCHKITEILDMSWGRRKNKSFKNCVSITCWQNESKDTNALEYSVQAMNDTAGSGDLSKTSASDNTDGKNSLKTWNITHRQKSRLF